MVTRDATQTVDTFWTQYAGQSYELIEGRIVAVSPAGGESPEVGLIVGSAILRFVMQHNLGKVTNAEGGYWLNDETLVAPDVAFYGWEKHKQHINPQSYRPFPPDLAVEVVSPSDKPDDVKRKVDLYIRADVRLVWVIYPQLRSASVYDHTGHYTALSAEDTLDGGSVLPGFSLPLTACFPPAPPTSIPEEKPGDLTST